MYRQVLNRKGLSLERLHLLCEVARQGGIRAAVGDDSVRQSLASRQLKELGEYVGAEVCRRNGRTLELTEAGSALVDIGNDFFQRLESFLCFARNLPVSFALGAGDSVFQWQLLPKMKRFGELFPGVTLHPYSYSADEILRRVGNRVLDAGIVRIGAEMAANLVRVSIGHVRYALFLPSGLAGGAVDSGDLSALAEAPFCTLTGNGAYVQAMEDFLAHFGGRPVLTCSSMTQMYAAVQSGQYAAVLPSNAEKGLAAQRVDLPELAPFTREMALVYRREVLADATKKAVIGFLRTIIANEE